MVLLQWLFDAVRCSHTLEDVARDGGTVLLSLDWILGASLHGVDRVRGPFPIWAGGIARLGGEMSTHPLDTEVTGSGEGSVWSVGEAQEAGVGGEMMAREEGTGRAFSAAASLVQSPDAGQMSGPFMRAATGGNRGRSDGRIPPPGIVLEPAGSRVIWRFIPIKIDSDVSGVLSLATSPLAANLWKSFSQCTRLISSMLGMALGRVLLERKKLIHVESIDLFGPQTLVEAMGGSLELVDTAKRMLEAFLRVSGFVEGAVYVNDEDRQAAELVYSNTTEEPLYPVVHFSAPDPIARAIRTQEPILGDFSGPCDCFANEGKEDRADSPLSRTTAIHGTADTGFLFDGCFSDFLKQRAIFPIVYRNRTIGVIVAIGKKSAVRSPGWSKEMQSLLRRISISLANAVLFRDAASYAMERDRRAAEFEAILQCSHDAIIVSGTDGRVSFINNRFREWFGVPIYNQIELPALLETAVMSALVEPESMTMPQVHNGRIESVFFSEDLLLTPLPGIAANSKVYSANHHLSIQQRPGLVKRSVIPVRSSSGQLLGRIESYRDLSSQIEAGRCRDDFLQLVGHELRTPLTPLYAYVQLMYKRASKNLPVGLDFVQNSMNLCQRMINIIDDFVGCSLYEPEKSLAHEEVSEMGAVGSSVSSGSPFPMEVGSDEVDLKKLVVAICNEHRCYPGRNRILTRMPQRPVRIIGDATSMSKVVHRLLDNALRFSPGGDLVEVEIQSRGGHVMLMVLDRGIGIPNGEKVSIFQRGKIASNASELRLAGFGYGLDVVKRVVSYHGGEVSVEPRPGGGSIFTVTLKNAYPRTADGNGGPHLEKKGD